MNASRSMLVSSRLSAASAATTRPSTGAAVPSPQNTSIRRATPAPISPASARPASARAAIGRSASSVNR